MDFIVDSIETDIERLLQGSLNCVVKIGLSTQVILKHRDTNVTRTFNGHYALDDSNIRKSTEFTTYLDPSQIRDLLEYGMSEQCKENVLIKPYLDSAWELDKINKLIVMIQISLHELLPICNTCNRRPVYRTFNL